MASISLSIARGSAWDESYDVWAKVGATPLEIGDGTYVGNFPILPSQSSITATATVPATASYGYLVAPVQARESLVFTTYKP